MTALYHPVDFYVNAYRTPSTADVAEIMAIASEATAEAEKAQEAFVAGEDGEMEADEAKNERKKRREELVTKLAKKPRSKVCVSFISLHALHYRLWFAQLRLLDPETNAIW